jgi:serine protease AprX
MTKQLILVLLIASLFLAACQVSPTASPAVLTPPPVNQTAIATIAPFQDVRNQDLLRLEASNGKPLELDAALISTLWFNQATTWPVAARPIAETVLKRGKNPGLGIRKLQAADLNGQGVNVAIIDQNLVDDHPEFAGKIVKYKDFGTGQSADNSSMHGPAVASLLVGETIGTAPGAKLYYAAAPSWKLDAQYYANALNWIIDENEALPEGQKIRAVSVSAAPSGPGTNFTQNNAAWDAAVQRAGAEDILVLDCTSDKGITAPCYYDPADPENVAGCTPGWPGMPFGASPERLHIPASYRTTAEEYQRGQAAYQYDGRGGLSWTVPYLAGVLALGWQLRPDLTSAELLELVFASAYRTADNLLVIDPPAFIESVKSAGP